jgi:hypothetical protein
VFANDELAAWFEEIVDLLDSIFGIGDTAKTMDLISTFSPHITWG